MPDDDAKLDAIANSAQVGAGTDAARDNVSNALVRPGCEIRVGPAGWSYPDWSGYVYPSPRPKGFHEATYLAQFFDTIEINTSFYSPLQPGHAHQWLERVAANPRFLFTAKLWQRFTHDTFPASPSIPDPFTAGPSTSGPFAAGLGAAGSTPTDFARPSSSKLSRSASGPTGIPGAADERAVRGGFDVLRNAGKLGAVLLQFPFSFHRTTETTVYLTSLLQRFGDYPLAVEVRHASWDDPEVFALLREHHAAFCNIDQPVIGRSLLPREGKSLEPWDVQSGPSDKSTSPIGYIRLHGRRYDTWFSDDPTIPSHERYNYLYSSEELSPWAGRIQTESEHTRRVFAVTNNHYLGKGVVNALQLISMLKGAKVNVPEQLRQHYPELDKIASLPPEKPTLFPMGTPTKG
jgi:uncharacterized protein YecE (DUF72 family)